MDKLIQHLKKEWKVYAMAIWMAGITVYLVCLQNRIEMLQNTCLKIHSIVDATENILISTDSNVAQTKKQIDEMMPKIDNVHARVMRR
ncbi:hypothetical protein JCM12296A_40000 [Desulfosarcina cetonica]|uniref:hypothetical protein n=1 Tax=Desulfosarcina cetonica TaxID=90730 RepID=UPI0012ED42C5|nr:hypothetical protein [Desulfosarcina cetonica]